MEARIAAACTTPSLRINRGLQFSWPQVLFTEYKLTHAQRKRKFDSMAQNLCLLSILINHWETLLQVSPERCMSLTPTEMVLPAWCQLLLLTALCQEKLTLQATGSGTDSCSTSTHSEDKAVKLYRYQKKKKKGQGSSL